MVAIRYAPLSRVIIASCELSGDRRGRALRAAVVERDLVDLRPAGTIGREIDRAPVERPDRLGVDRLVRGHALERLAREIERVDVEIAVARERERELACIGRPRGRAVD